MCAFKEVVFQLNYLAPCPQALAGPMVNARETLTMALVGDLSHTILDEFT